MTGETETRLTGEVGAQVAEEIDIGVPDDFGAQAAESGTPAPKLQHTVPDRGRARDLFEQLCALPIGDAERLRIVGRRKLSCGRTPEAFQPTGSSMGAGRLYCKGLMN